MADVVAQVVGRRSRSGRGRGRDTLAVFDAVRRLGPPLTRQAEPTGFRAGLLTLKVFGSVWMTELSFMIPTLKARLNRTIGREVVQDVRLVAGPPARRTGARGPLPPLTPEELDKVERWGAEITRPEVRAAVLRAASRHLARNRR